MNKQNELTALDFATLDSVCGGASFYYTNNNGVIDTNMTPEQQAQFGISPGGGFTMPSLPSFGTPGMPTLPNIPGLDWSSFGF